MVGSLLIQDGAGNPQYVQASTGNGQISTPFVTDHNVVNVVSTTSSQATYTDRSGTITAGGTAQQIMAVNANRKGFYIQNVSNSNLYISATGTASNVVTAGSGSLLIPPNALYESPFYGIPTNLISIFGATTGQAYVAREW
jgi:hypothetical protein